jgi:CBS domain-containing protein
MRDTHHHVPTAREIMTRSLVTLTPEMTVLSAVSVLLRHRISGAPVVDAAGRFLGIFSELDCLRVLAAGEFYSDDPSEEGSVGVQMTDAAKCRSVSPDVDIYSLAQYFLTHSVRRLPVLDGNDLVGQVSRRDVLGAMEKLSQRRASKKHYPDYREPSQEVGARRAH